MRRFASILLVLVSSLASAQFFRYNGSCEQGGARVQTQGMQSSTKVQQSFPACTVDVFLHGTNTHASLFTNETGTVPLANPFTATSTGVAAWYAVAGHYDVQYSGAGITTPFTVSDINLGGTGGGGTPLTLQTNGIANAVQSLQNLQQGANVTITDNGAGTITVASTAGGGGGDVKTAPSADQNIVQPVGTQFSADNMAGTRVVAASFNWTQSPSSPAALTAGVQATVTLAPCPKGVSGLDTTSFVHIAGTGTPEDVPLQGGGSCTPGAASGTILFTPSGSHGAGYTLSSASGGLQEAMNDPANFSGSSGNANLWLAPAGTSSSNITNVYTVTGVITPKVNQLSLWGGGAVIKCASVWGRCFNVSSTNNPVHFHDVRFASSINTGGVAVTQTACTGTTATITAANHGYFTGEYIDIQKTFKQYFWGIHQVASVPDANTFTYTVGANCDGNGTITAAATTGYTAPELSAIHVTSQGNTLDNVMIINPGGISGQFNNGVVNDNDQALKIDGLNITGTRCDANGYCGQAIYMPGPFSTNAGVTWISNSNLSMSCKGNGITNHSGNTLGVINSVVQGFNEWGVLSSTIRGSGGGTNATTIQNVYEEVGICTNPNMGIVAASGVILHGTSATITQGIGPSGRLPQFTGTTGANTFAYYIVVKDSVLGTSAPLLAGRALAGATGNPAVQWYRVPGTNTVTYDILRVGGATALLNAPSTAACTGGSVNACGSVAVAQAQCSTMICSFTDNVANNTAAYTVVAPTYLPQVPYWTAGGILISPASDTNNLNARMLPVKIDDYIPSSNASIVSTVGTLYPSVMARTCSQGGTTFGSSIWIMCEDMASNNAGNAGVGNQVEGATILREGGLMNGGPGTGYAGRLGFLSSAVNGTNQNDVITLVYSDPALALGTANYRPLAQAADTAISFDSASVNLNQVRLAFRAPISISNYLNSKADGTSWKTRLDSIGLHLQTPLSLETGSSFTQTTGNHTLSGTGTFDTAAMAHTLSVKAGTVAAIPATCTFTAGSKMEVYLATDATAGQNLYFCTATNIWTQQLNSGAAGMNTAASNAAAVAVAADWKPNAAAGFDLGSSTLAWKDLYLAGSSGTPGTNRFHITGTATGARDISLPNLTTTLAGLAVNQTWTGTNTFNNTVTLAAVSSTTSATANPASAGWARLATTDCINFRNNANGADVTGMCKDTNDIVQIGSSGMKTGGPFYLQTSPLDVTRTNDTTTGTGTNLLVSLTSAGNAIKTPAGAIRGVIGIARTGAGTSGSATITQIGQTSCIFDGGATPGDFVGISPSLDGNCTDLGLVPGNTQTVGMVLSLVSGTVYNVLVNLGAAPSTPASNTVITNPSVTQTIQPTADVPALVLKQFAGGTGDIFQVLLSGGTKVFSINSTGQAVFGTGTSNVTASSFTSSSSNPASTGFLRAASSDPGLCFRNNGNTNDVCLSKNTSDVFTFNGTSGILIKQAGASFATTLSFPTPGADRTITFQAPSGAVDVAYLTEPQVFANKGFSDFADFTAQGSAPANPSATKCRLYYDNATTKLKAVNNTGADCGFAGTGGAAALSGITNATGANTLANGDFAQIWGWTLTTAAKTAFLFNETAPATAGAGSQFLVGINTSATSTAKPITITAGGTANGVEMSLTGYLTAKGANAGFDVGTVLGSDVFQCPNDGVTGTTAKLIAKYTTSNTCIKATTADLASVEGIVVTGGTTGNAQIAKSGYVTCTFSNTAVVGDYVGVSGTVAGNCLDLGANPVASAQVLGRAVTAGAGDQTVLIYPQGKTAFAGTTNQVNLAFTGGLITFSLPQSINTTAAPQFGGLLLGTGATIHGAGNGTSYDVLCGSNATSGTACTLTLRGSNMTGTGNANAGDVVVEGGSSSSTGTGRAGNVDIQSGAATAAANKNGYLHFGPNYIKGATYTTSAVLCFSADNTLSDCATSATNQVAVALSSNGNSAITATQGSSQVTLLYDATVTPSAGWFACTSATVAGKVTAQATACAAGRQVGIIEIAGTNVTSGPATLTFK